MSMMWQKLLIADLAAGAVTLAYKSKSSSTSTSLTLPSDIVAGDLIFTANRSTNSTTGEVVPTGFTKIASLVGSTRRFVVCYKVATSGDASASISGMDGSPTFASFVFSTGVSSPSTNLSTVGSSISDSVPTSQTIASGSGTPPLIALGFFTSNFNFTPTFTPNDGFESSSDNKIEIGYKIYNSSPANITEVSMPDAGSGNAIISFYMEAA